VVAREEAGEPVPLLGAGVRHHGVQHLDVLGREGAVSGRIGRPIPDIARL
jgi:hypothetical protein